MGKEKSAEISVEDLLADGWVKTKDPVFPMEKEIENRNPLNAGEDSDIKLILHNLFGTMFAVLLPDGGMLNFVANTMQELKDFESRINFYDPPF